MRHNPLTTYSKHACATTFVLFPLQDYALAQRNYDAAVEADPRVKVPVSLALAKLRAKQSWVHFLDSATSFDAAHTLRLGTESMREVAEEDTVLLVFLAFLLGALVRLRHQLYRRGPT